MTAMWKARATQGESELGRLLAGRPNFKVHFSKSQVSASLWDFGEDKLAERALGMGDSDLLSIQAIAAWYEDPTYVLPVEVRRISHLHVTALAAITYFEGAIRPLARTRRRPAKDRPSRFDPVPPEFGTVL